MLILAGLGLYDEKDLSLKAVEAARQSDLVFIERYTSPWKGSIEAIEKIIGKAVEELSRSDLEEGSEKIVSLAKEKNVLIFVPGDPLVATTHASLLIDCLKAGVKTRVIHGSSILSAVAESGLHIYRFGATVTIPKKAKTLPVSVYEAIKANLANNCHTLCLLDVGLSVGEALDVLLGLESELKGGLFSEDKKLVACFKLGSDSPSILFSSIDKLKKARADLPAVIIVPAKLHFSEEEYLSHFTF